MSAHAATLQCPLCLHIGFFDSVQSLRDRLIFVSTNKILCPVCQDEICGLDKLTIHLFSHVQLPAPQVKIENQKTKNKTKTESMTDPQQKKSRALSKNKPQTPKENAPVKFVKIYPKLPVISLNVVDITQTQLEECANTVNSFKSSVPKTETPSEVVNTICNICGLQFVDANILKMHRCLIHNVDENSNQAFTRYNCHLCPKNFKMRGSLMVHLRVAHFGFSDKSSTATKTDTVERDFKGPPDQSTSDKSENIDRNDGKQWQCDVCRKCFTTKYFLKKHKRLHTGETPYACTQCNKTFTFQQSYHKHLLYHNDEKPHVCTYCGRAFKELSTLHNHQRIHTGEKPFSCETCGKCFRQRVSYLVHRRIHTGAMPYKCTACDKSFRYKVSQRTHKCPAQPPGTVVRQSGELVEKLKKKCIESDILHNDNQSNHHASFPEISEAHAELVRTGAKLSLEDTVNENFSLIESTFDDSGKNVTTQIHTTNYRNSEDKGLELLDHNNIDELIDSIPLIDKSVPSPSEILKKLCLSKDEKSDNTDAVTPVMTEFNMFL